MKAMEITVTGRGQIIISREARDALGLKPGAHLQLRAEDDRVVIEKLVRLHLSRWVGKAVDDGLTTDQALSELRGRVCS